MEETTPTTTNVSSIPWQIILIAFIALVLVAIIIILIKNNKNLKANGKFKENEIGIEITDSNNSKGKKEDDTEMIDNLALSYLSMLKIHPIFTSIINNILYNTSVNYREKELFKVILGSENPDFTKLSRLATIANYFMKCYVISLKAEIEIILTETKNDLEEGDKSFKKSSQLIDNLIKDVELDTIISSTTDNIKIAGVNFNELEGPNSNKKEREQIPPYTFELFKKHIKTKTPELYRNLLISKNMMKTHLSINKMRPYSFVTGLGFLLNSVLDHLYILCSEIKLEFLLDLSKEELNKDKNRINNDTQNDGEFKTANINDVSAEDIEYLDSAEDSFSSDF